MTLQHSGSGTTLGRVTSPSLFGGDTQFSVASVPGSANFSGVLFDASIPLENLKFSMLIMVSRS